MASYVPAKKNTEFIFYIGLVDQADPLKLKSAPTIASGDFKVSIDGGALANLTTLPAVTPGSSVMVKVTLSTSEMNGDNITFVAIDAAGDEWCDLVVNIQTAAAQIDDIYTRIGAAGAGLTAVPYNSAWDAEIQSEVTDALNAYDPPTNTEFEARSLVAASYATASALATVGTNVDSILVDTGTTLQAELDGIQADTEDIQARLPAALVTGRMDSSVGAMAADTLTASAVAADAVTELQSGLATAAALATVDQNVDDILVDTGTTIPGTITTLDSVADAIKVVTDQLGDTLELDVTVYRFTTNALEQAPTGGSAPSAATIRAEIDANSTQLAAIKGQTDLFSFTGSDVKATLDGETVTPADGSITAVKIATDAITAAKLAADAIAEMQSGLSTLDAAGVRTAVGLATANLDTQLGDLPTNSELTTALAGADANADLATLLSRTAGGVTYTAPVNPNTQSLALNQSQDYLAADGGQLPEWSSTAWTPFSLSTAASVTWYIRDFDGTLRSGAVNVVSDTELDVRTFANAVTALLTPGDDPKRKVQVWAVLDVAHGSAHKKLVDAKVTVSDDIRN